MTCLTRILFSPSFFNIWLLNAAKDAIFTIALPKAMNSLKLRDFYEFFFHFCFLGLPKTCNVKEYRRFLWRLFNCEKFDCNGCNAAFFPLFVLRPFVVLFPRVSACSQKLWIKWSWIWIAGKIMIIPGILWCKSYWDISKL